MFRKANCSLWLSEVVSLAWDLGDDGSSLFLLRYPLTRLDNDWKRPLFGDAAFSDMLLRLRRQNDYRASTKSHTSELRLIQVKSD